MKIKPAKARAPAIEPTAIPAIAPPDRPFPSLSTTAGEPVAVALGTPVVKVSVGLIDGSTTPWHLDSASEL